MRTGTKVTAIGRVTEGGVGSPGDSSVKDVADPNYIHAEPGDVGVVEEVDDEDEGVYYVVFDRQGTGCLVEATEVAPMYN